MKLYKIIKGCVGGVDGETYTDTIEHKLLGTNDKKRAANAKKLVDNRRIKLIATTPDAQSAGGSKDETSEG